MSDFIAQKLAEKEAAQARKAAMSAKQDQALRDRIAKKLKGITIVKKPPFWWVPAFFRDKLWLAHKVGELDRMVFDYADFCSRQSADLKALYKWALEHDDGTMEDIKAKLGPLDPADMVKGGKYVPLNPEVRNG